MPKRYICRECKNIDNRKKTCRYCGKDMEEVKFPWKFRTFLPYLMASIAAVLLLAAYMTGMTILIWIVFIPILVGLILDHLYQKELDRKAREIIRYKP